jgi:NADPH:quinone reductase-like Zn-dependent oxidoreductase
MVRSTEMQALIVERVNGPFVLTRLPIPNPGAHQALVRVHASGVNPLDTKIRAGNAAHAGVVFPAVLGVDLAGVVEEIGNEVNEFREGDEVYAMGGGVGGLQGSLATHIVVDVDLLALKPKNLSMREAAAMPLAVVTAWEGLVDRARVREGNKVLVHAGAGGVGHVAVQIALALGARVFATVSKDKMKIVENYGATAINYQQQQVESYVADYTGSEGFDVVYDTVGGTTLDDSFMAAKIYTGHVVSCLGWGTHKLAPLSFRGATYSGVFTLLPLLSGKNRRHHGDILRQATALAEAGKLKPLLNPERFTFGTAVEAHRAVESGKALGKIVVEIE